MLGPLNFSASGALPTMALAQTTNPAASTVIAPALLFVLCAIAAAGVMLLLPGRREATLRRIGAVVLASAAIVLAAFLSRSAGGMGAYFWIFAAIAIVGAVRVITHTRPVYSALYFVLTVMASAGLFVLMWAEFMAAALILIYAGAILVTYVFVIMLAAEAQPAGQGPALSEQLAEHDAISREPVLASAVGFALLGMLLFVIFDKASANSRYGYLSYPVPGQGFKLNNSIGAEFAVAADIGPGLPPEVIAATQAAATQPVVAAIQPPLATGFQPVGQTQRLGAYLFDKQIVNLELAGLILTVAMVGAIVIARKRVVSTEPAFARRGPTETLTAPMTPVDDNPHSIPVYGTENPRQKEYPET